MKLQKSRIEIGDLGGCVRRIGGVRWGGGGGGVRVDVYEKMKLL